MRYAIQYEYADGGWSDPEWCENAADAIAYIHYTEAEEDEEEVDEDE